MPTYTVHEPQPFASDLDERATSLVFVREGFAWLGFLAPVLWLLYNRMWLDLLLFILIVAAVIGLVGVAGGNEAVIGWVMLLINLGFGLEARNVYRAALARSGHALIGVVTGRDLEEAERRFLSEWLPEVQSSAGGPATASPTPDSSGGGSMPIIGAGMAHG
jgi:Protein of unknown function (DUF2628)